MFVKTIQDLLDTALQEREDLFLIDFSVSNENAIKIIVDGDNGVKVEDCIFLSRAIEHNIDREEHDFSLEVASAGAASPLKIPRQYKKNIGRKLEVKTATNTFEGNLTIANTETICLEWKANRIVVADGEVEEPNQEISLTKNS